MYLQSFSFFQSTLKKRVSLPFIYIRMLSNIVMGWGFYSVNTTSAEKWGNRSLPMGSTGFKSCGEKEWGNGFLSLTDRITVSTPIKSSAIQHSSSKISSTKFLNQHWLLAIEEERVHFFLGDGITRLLLFQIQQVNYIYCCIFYCSISED